MVKVLVAPGSGDVHWVMLKMESIIEKHFGGVTPGVYVWCAHPRTKRSKGYIEMIPFVKWGGYFDAGPYKEMGKRVFEQGRPYMVTGWKGFDLFVAFNNPLERGIELKNIMPKFKANYDYPIMIPPSGLKMGDELADKYGSYVVVWFCNRGFYKGWMSHLTIAKIKRLLESLRKRNLKVVITGKEWDADFMNSLAGKDDVNLVDKTSMAQLLGICKRARAFVGHAAGNGMLAQHIGCKTFMYWHPKTWTPQFMTNWADPAKINKVYYPLSVLTDAERYINDHI